MSLPNEPAKGISYFTPAQNPPSGTILERESVPKLFTPLKLRGLTLQNRIGLSPLCQYSADDGHFTPWHMAHLGGIISRGPGLSFVEATAITPEGRISPEDNGIWKDSHIEPMRQVVEFAHSQGQKIAIQLAHAGRKASTVAPWLSAGKALATEEVGGWPSKVISPSAIPYNDEFAVPIAMTEADIEGFKTAWAAAVKRALAAGFDIIEVHSAHGYLLHNFLSPVSNNRTDRYGGSFENRIRLLLEVVELSRSLIPDDMPLFVRVSASDFLNHAGFEGESWGIEDTVKLAPLLAERGVDLLDVSAGGNHPKQKLEGGVVPGYQTPFAKAIKKAVGDTMAVSAVGSISDGKQAEAILTGKGEGSHGEQEIDLVFAGRWFQKDPSLVWTWAEQLGVNINLANQIGWPFAGRGKRKPAKTE